MKIATVFLATAAIAGTSFILCGYWIYHYIDLEDIFEKQGDKETEGTSVTL